MGDSPKKAENNLREIIEYVEYCIVHDVNGIRQNIRRRFLLTYLRILVSVISAFTLSYAIYQCILENFPMDLLIITAVIAVLGILCLYVNSITRRF